MRHLENLRLIFGCTRAAWALVFVALWSWPTDAYAGRAKPVKVEFEVASGWEPTHVCVITNHAPTDDSWTVGQVRSQVRSGKNTSCQEKEGSEKDACEMWDQIIAGLSDKPSEKSEFGADCYDGTEIGTYGCLVDLDVEIGDKIEDKNAISCVGNGTAQADSTNDRVRVVVFNLTTRLDPRISVEIKDLSLTGNVLELGVDVDVDAAVAVLEVVTGQYLRGANTALSAEGTGSLQLQPRCEWVTFALPPLVTTKAWEERAAKQAEKPRAEQLRIHTLVRGNARRSTIMEASKDDWSKCVQGDLRDSVIDILIPVDTERMEKKELEIELLDMFVLKPEKGSTEEMAEAEARKNRIVLEASWNGPLPGPAARLRAKQFVLTWEADECLYVPKRKCPALTVEETGESCESIGEKVNAGVCYYSCGPVASFQASEDPLHVRFSEEPLPVVADNEAGTKPEKRAGKRAGKWKGKQPRGADEWVLEARFLNEVLHGYVDAGDRDIRAQIPSNSETKGTFAGVSGLEFVYVDAQGRENPVFVRSENLFDELDEKERIIKYKSVVVDTPGVVCGAPVSYWYVGDRDYRVTEEFIESGELPLQNPEALARRGYLYLHTGGFAQFQSRSSLRGADSDGVLTPGLEIEAGAAIWPRNIDWRFEVRFGVMLNSVDAYPLAQADARRKVPYFRGLVGVGFQSPWFGRFGNPIPLLSLGAGAYVLTGRPLRQHDAVAYFDPEWRRFDAGFRFAVDGRVRMPFTLRSIFWRRVELVARVSTIVGEDSPKVVNDLRGEPTLELRRGQAIWTLVGLGLAVSL